MLSSVSSVSLHTMFCSIQSMFSWPDRPSCTKAPVVSLHRISSANAPSQFSHTEAITKFQKLLVTYIWERYTAPVLFYKVCLQSLQPCLNLENEVLVNYLKVLQPYLVIYFWDAMVTLEDISWIDKFEKFLKAAFVVNQIQVQRIWTVSIFNRGWYNFWTYISREVSYSLKLLCPM